jgi:hypothetical protein
MTWHANRDPTMADTIPPGKPCAKCPSAALEAVPGDGFSVDRSPQCGGKWVDGGEFLRIRGTGLKARLKRWLGY